MLSRLVVRLLKRIVVNFPHKTITSPDGRPYLTRWYVWPKGPRTDDSGGEGVTPNSPFALFVHFFHRSDDDRDQHNHPWGTSLALVLAGGYHEERGDYSRIVKPGRFNLIRHDDYHRVDLLKPEEGSWSLFLAGRHMQDWGFRDTETQEHIPQEEYLARKFGKVG